MSGELPGVRETMDRFRKQLTESGMSPEKAAEKARQAAERHDRMRREGRIQNPDHQHRKPDAP